MPTYQRPEHRHAALAHFLLMLISAAWSTAGFPAESGTGLFAAAAAGQVERVDSLLAEGADVNAKNAAGRTPLQAAAAAGNVRIVRKLLAFGADPNAADARGVTPLMEAAGNGYVEVVKALAAGGADLNAKNAGGATVLDHALKNGHAHVTALLEKLGAKSGEQPQEAPGEELAEKKNPDSSEEGGSKQDSETPSEESKP